MSDKIRKYTRCVKKYPREELIKHNGSEGGLFCETCAEKRKLKWFDVGIFILVVIIIVCFIFWLFYKFYFWWDSKQEKDRE